MQASKQLLSISSLQSFGQWLIVVFIILASGLYLWQSDNFFKQSQKFKTERDQYLLEKTKSNLGILLHELRRDVVLLAQSQQDRIESLISDPEDLDLYDELLGEIKDIYPDVFTATIADNSGKAIIANFDGFIQQVCIDDLSSYASDTFHPDIYIHPNPFLYHFDLMSKITVENQQYIFFVSFDAALISRALKNSIAPGYKLVLINKDIDYLIEVTEQGSRNMLNGDNFLSEDEKKNLVGEIDIPETKWKLLLINSGSDQPGYNNASPENQFWPIALFNIICIIALILLQIMKKRMKNQELLLQEKTNDLSFSREHLLAVFNSVLDAMVTISNDSIITAFNPAAENMFGYQSKEILGENIKVLIPEQFHGDHDDFMKTYRETGSAKIIGSTRKAIGLKKNGDTFPSEISVSDVKYRDKVEFVAMIRDISHRTHIEKMKTEFISTVSHEMRTPLTSIRGSLGLIAGGVMKGSSPKVQRLINIALNNTERMIKLINEILDIDRIENGSMLFHFDTVALKSVLLDSIENIKGFADEHSITIDFRCLCEDCTVRADRGRLAQVVINLLSNAIKFSSAESTVLVILDCDEDACTLSIKDTGIGIAEDNLESIFDKFTQIDSSDTRDIGGSGLGLCIVKSIINAHHGSIEVESKLGTGSTFIIKLSR